MYGDKFRIAPYSVLVDPYRAERILGLETNSKTFSPKVLYIYRKQLEEAEIIVVNKVDLLVEERLQRLVNKRQEEIPNSKVHTISARDGTRMPDWYNLIHNQSLGNAAVMDVDYDVYADGEALLGWVNVGARLKSDSNIDGNAMVKNIISKLQKNLHDQDFEIAHLKSTLTPDQGNDLAVANLVCTEGKVEFSHELQDAVQGGELLINLRAEADPESLVLHVHNALAELQKQQGLVINVLHSEAFRPGRPVPTHRDLQPN